MLFRVEHSHLIMDVKLPAYSLGTCHSFESTVFFYHVDLGDMFDTYKQLCNTDIWCFSTVAWLNSEKSKTNNSNQDDWWQPTLYIHARPTRKKHSSLSNQLKSIPIQWQWMILIIHSYFYLMNSNLYEVGQH